MLSIRKNFICRAPVSMVMVAYNEAGHIARIIDEYDRDVFRHLPPGSEFIIYLDAPTDATPDIVKKLASERHLTVIAGEENLGYRRALTKGLHAARNDIVFYSDSSGKHRAADFWALVEYEPVCDIVTGLRRFHNYSSVRRMVTFCQRLLIAVLFGMPLYDFNTGFKIVHKSVLDDVLDECKHTKQSFSSELLIRAYKKGYTVKNVPVLFKEREDRNTGTNARMLPGIMWHSVKGLVKLRVELFVVTLGLVPYLFHE